MILQPSQPSSRPATRRRRGQKQNQNQPQSHTIVGTKLGVASLPKFVSPLYHASHKYVESFGITGGAAGVFGTVYPYALNGMFDPYLGVGGHQPYGFDELSPWYNSFCVTHVSVSITVAAPSNDANILGIAWRPSAGSFNPAGLGMSDFMEKDNTRWVLTNTAPARYGDTTIQLEQFDIAKIEGKTRAQILAENEYQGTPAGNPASVPQLFFTLGSCTGVSSVTCQLIVELTYHAVWRGPKTFGQS